jgi:hypothetical protein
MIDNKQWIFKMIFADDTQKAAVWLGRKVAVLSMSNFTTPRSNPHSK